MQTVLVTGGTGFMGANLIMQLVRRGYVVYPLVRSVENPAQDVRILGVPEIRGASISSSGLSAGPSART
jgi:uncharacterized protein YbjT (DUF2867 family)